MLFEGTFSVNVSPEPPHDVVDGVSIGRVRVDKRFEGPLDATSVVDMIGARTPVEGSAGYVAIERVTGTLAGRRGTFVLQHLGRMSGGAMSLTVLIVPDSGTAELAGISGNMIIRIEGGRHFYALDVELPARA
jgi:hypothetical protein